MIDTVNDESNYNHNNMVRTVSPDTILLIAVILMMVILMMAACNTLLLMMS